MVREPPHGNEYLSSECTIVYLNASVIYSIEFARYYVSVFNQTDEIDVVMDHPSGNILCMHSCEINSNQISEPVNCQYNRSNSLLIQNNSFKIIFKPE